MHGIISPDQEEYKTGETRLVAKAPQIFGSPTDEGECSSRHDNHLIQFIP